MSQEIDKISQFMGAATGVEQPERNKVVEVDDVKDMTKSVRDKQKENFEKDYDDARLNIKELITETMDVLPNLIQVTREAENAQMYLAASSFVKMIADLNKDLLAISTTKDGGPSGKALAVPEKPEANNTTVYIGTSEGIFKQFSRRNKDQSQEGEFVIVDDSSKEEPKSAVSTVS